MEDGSFLGALPFFPFDDKANSKLEFDGLHEHMRLRLKDSTLLTSSNLAYIMYSFNSVLYLSLTKCHTKQLFKRGLQTISIGKYRPHQLTSTESVLKMDSVDSEVHVNRLGTACASETPDLFRNIHMYSKGTSRSRRSRAGNLRTLPLIRVIYFNNLIKVGMIL